MWGLGGPLLHGTITTRFPKTKTAHTAPNKQWGTTKPQWPHATPAANPTQRASTTATPFWGGWPTTVWALSHHPTIPTKRGRRRPNTTSKPNTYHTTTRTIRATSCPTTTPWARGLVYSVHTIPLNVSTPNGQHGLLNLGRLSA